MRQPIFVLSGIMLVTMSATADRFVLEERAAIADRRAHDVRHTDTVFTMREFESVSAWEVFAADLRERILLSSGLWPAPEKTPLKAKVFDRMEGDGYTIEKVHFDAFPGLLVTGNLYRPIGDGPFPGVIAPHGHWSDGRFANEERGSVPGRAITLARMGMVCFTYDMVGYNDSMQLTHRWSRPKCAAWGLHPFAIQLWSSIRALDFLETLPDVDPDRLACTGASGGGTQTFAVSAVDPRVKVAAPVNMISSTMQGGCVCENAPIIRFENSNMEIGALMAPRPLLLVSATGDWTVKTPEVEYPAIRSIYALYDADENVKNVHIDAGHNYNQASREAMYRFFGPRLLGEPVEAWAEFTEPPFTVRPVEELRVFPDGELPPGYEKSTAVLNSLIERRKARATALSARLDSDPDFANEVRHAIALTLGAATPEADALAPEQIGMEPRDRYLVERLILRRPETGAAIPALLYRSIAKVRQPLALLVHGAGKAAFAAAEGGPGDAILGLLGEGKAVMTIDPFLTGEHHPPGGATERATVGAFMDTFHPTDTALRVQDILTAVAYARGRGDLTGIVHLHGFEDGAVWSAYAGAIEPRIDAVILHPGEIADLGEAAFDERFYIPSIKTLGGYAAAKRLAGATEQ